MPEHILLFWKDEQLADTKTLKALEAGSEPFILLINKLQAF
jgi:hypothetical protein